MMNKAFNKVIKSHVLLAVLSVFAAVLLTTGVTYSLFQSQNKNATNQTIAVGDLSADMTSIEGAMILNDLYPEEAKKITDDDKKYSFTLSNTGTYDLKYEIYLVDATDAILNKDDTYASYKKMDPNHYQFINYKLDGKEVANLESVNENSKFMIMKGILKAGATEDHYLQFFLDNKDTTVTGAPNDISGSIISLDIYMDATVSDSLVDSIIANAIDAIPSETDAGLYKTVDDYGETYYYKGNVNNNYVKYAGLYWRIVRINGDGTMRLMYDGTSAHENTDRDIDRVALTNVSYTSSMGDAKYAGYMYGVAGQAASTSKEQAIANTNDSTIKFALDEWYKEHLENNSDGIIDRAFCNDRSTAREGNLWSEEDTALGYGNNLTMYGGWNRLSNMDTITPTLKCSSKEDAFTVTSERGNKSLKYPIGLLTADEIYLTGGPDSYINKGTFYWTMTPCNFTGTEIFVYGLNETGSLEAKTANLSGALVPVINLSNEITSKMNGYGTINDPYNIE